MVTREREGREGELGRMGGNVGGATAKDEAATTMYVDGRMGQQKEQIEVEGLKMR